MLLGWRLDRLDRNLRHLVVLLEELRAVGVAFVSLNEGIDATTPAGKLHGGAMAGRGRGPDDGTNPVIAIVGQVNSVQLTSSEAPCPC